MSQDAAILPDCMQEYPLIDNIVVQNTNEYVYIYLMHHLVV